MKRVIITGATSFIGTALLKLLIQKDYSVTACIRPHSVRKNLSKYLFPKIQFIECELDELNTLILPEEKYDMLFHLGWNADFPNSRYNLDGQMQNLRYCERAVELAARYHCKAFLAVGSQAECGIVHTPISSITPDNPLNAYAEVKCMSYDRTKQLCHEWGIQQYWPRLLSAYGPYDHKETLIMSCIRACREQRIIELTPAEQIWDYVYVEDVARAFLGIVERGVPEKKYAVASGQGRPLKDYVAEISELMGFPKLIEGIGKKSYTEQQVMYLLGDISELYQDTQVEMKQNFKQGIYDTILHDIIW